MTALEKPAPAEPTVPRRAAQNAARGHLTLVLPPAATAIGAQETLTGAPPPLAAVRDSWRRRAWQRRLDSASRLLRGLLSNPASAVGVALVALHVGIGLVGPAIAPYPATEMHVADKLLPPSAAYPLGTDQFGRDVLSRVLTGARGILLLSTAATLLGLFLGMVVGLAAGYAGGLVDEVLMRAMDVVMSFPSLLLALLVLTMVGPAIQNVVVGVGIVFMPRVARVVRSAVLTQRSLEYVQAARLRGEGPLYVLGREILPNVMGPVVVEGAIRISYAILLGASLGFLGLGVQPPAPDWGLMISEARNFLHVAPWIALVPAGAIATLVVGLNLLADGISREMDN